MRAGGCAERQVLSRRRAARLQTRHGILRADPVQKWCAMAKRRVRSLWLTALVFGAGSALAPAVAFLRAPAVAAQTDARPNIVVILVDDMGWSDIGPFGSEIATPNLDALAARGVRFAQFYATPRCSPTRASLLTGLYPHQAGMGHLDNVIRQGSLGTTGRLNDSPSRSPRCCARRAISPRCLASGISVSRTARRPGSAASIAR